MIHMLYFLDMTRVEWVLQKNHGQMETSSLI